MGGDGSWTSKDRALALALTVYEDGICQVCGGPKVECRNPDNEGHFNARSATCYRKAATEQWQRDNERRKDWRPDPGLLVYASLGDKPEPERPTIPGWD